MSVSHGVGVDPVLVIFRALLKGRSRRVGATFACTFLCVCVCVPVCPSSPPPPDPAQTVGLNNRIPLTPPHAPSFPFPHPCLQAIAWTTPGRNYLKAPDCYRNRVRNGNCHNLFFQEPKPEPEPSYPWGRLDYMCSAKANIKV